jgi:F0F1-type ATP synthase assembly protein I
MGEKILGDERALSDFVTQLTKRVNELEAELKACREQEDVRIAEAAKAQVAQLQAENHAMKVRIQAVALILRP